MWVMNDLRSRGTRITFGLGRSVADEKESTARSVARVGIKCMVKDSKEEESYILGVIIVVTSRCSVRKSKEVHHIDT